MNGARAATDHRARERIVLVAVSTALMLAQAIVFAALGLALFAMGQSLGLSASETGAGYTVQVLACCIAAFWPVPLIRMIGAGRTIALGLIVLALACALLAAAGTHGQLYLGTALAGVGFSLCANAPGVYLISGWSGARAGAAIGIYLMVGNLGNALGPPLAQAIIGGAGWRVYWLACALASVVVALACAGVLREPPSLAEEEAGSWTQDLGMLLRSPRFACLALALVASQLCFVTVYAVAPAHLAGAGFSTGSAARALAIGGLSSTLVSGLAGALSHRLAPRRMLQASLVMQAAGMALLAWPQGAVALYGFAVLAGTGIGLTTLAVTLLLVRYFGSAMGSSGLAVLWTLAGLAAFGPWLAGMAADAGGGYAMPLAALGLMLLPVTAVCLALPREPAAAPQ